MNKEMDGKKGPHRWRGGTLPAVEEERVDELLELIWTLKEKGVADMDQLLEEAQDVEARSILRSMNRDGLFEMEGNRMVLKDRGEEKAREIIRRHRLTERLFTEVFEMSEEVLHGSIVPTVAASGHGWSNVILLGEDKIRLRTVLMPLVTMEDESISDLFFLFGLAQVLLNQGNRIVPSKSMCHDEVVEQVFDGG